MPRQSAGIVLYRKSLNNLEVFLVHPGGPYYKNKDEGVWSIPKGEYTDDEEALTAAKREFTEETGTVLNIDKYIPLQPVKQKGGKIVHAWAAEGTLDISTVCSNTIPLEYPYKSGKWITIPEVDKGGWFDLSTAREKIIPAQTALIDELESIVAAR